MLYTVVFILAVRFIFHILPILLGGLLGWITAPLCRLLEKRLHLSHKRAALCTAVAVYSVSLVLLGAHMAGIAAVDLRCAEEFFG